MQINISSNNAQEEVEQSFFFQAIPNKGLQQKQLKECLQKWGLGQTLKIGSYRFNQHFQAYDSQRFMKDLFSNPNVRYINSNLKHPAQSCTTVQYQKLSCQQLSLEIFDEFQKQGLVKNDYIQKCMSQYFEGIQVCDKIRECLLLQESQSYCLYSEQKRNQFLFKVFQMLVIGGSLNQYQDKITPYLEWTKKIYKTLVSVRKKPETSEIFVESLAFKIKSMNQGKIKIQDYNPQNFTYVVINPSIRIVHVLTNQWVKFW